MIKIKAKKTFFNEFDFKVCRKNHTKKKQVTLFEFEFDCSIQHFLYFQFSTRQFHDIYFSNQSKITINFVCIFCRHKYVKTTIITGNVVVLGSGVDVAKLKK